MKEYKSKIGQILLCIIENTKLEELDWKSLVNEMTLNQMHEIANLAKKDKFNFIKEDKFEDYEYMKKAFMSFAVSRYFNSILITILK